MNRQKKIELRLRLTLREAREVRLMLYLHAGRCGDHLDGMAKIAGAYQGDQRFANSVKSWSRQQRKARALARLLDNEIAVAEQCSPAARGLDE